MHYIHHITRLGFLVCLLLITSTSCKKLVQVDPPSTSITGESVYRSDITATAVMTGVYNDLSGNAIDNFRGINPTLTAALSADELDLWSGSGDPVKAVYYSNNLSSSSDNSFSWEESYRTIFTCNSVLEGINKSTSLTPRVKDCLNGEALFMRSFTYFYLVNLYGDVPLVTSTDYTVNAVLAREKKEVVYARLINDLKTAITLLPEVYVGADLLAYPSSSVERTRPNKWAAIALLARIYLYTGDFANAEIQASILIDHPALFSLTSLSVAFNKNSLESIWQLQPVVSGYNTSEATIFIIPPTGFNSTNCVWISPFLKAAFEPGDLRATQWVDSYISTPDTFYYPRKYKNNVFNSTLSEYETVFRLSECYLIRAEARIMQPGKLASGMEDLNILRSRARATPTLQVPNPLPALSVSLNQADALAAVLHERQTELFTEWGHRWLDLKRSGKINDVMPVVCQHKSGIWDAHSALYPIPIDELLSDGHLKQNPGY